MGIRNITSSIYTIEYGDNLLNCYCVASNIDLYFTSSRNYFNSITIRKLDSTVNTVTIHSASGETIEGNSTIVLNEVSDYKTLTPIVSGWVISGTSLNMSGLSDNEILMKNGGSTVKGSGVIQVGNELESELSLVLPPNSLHLGDNISIHENGGFIEYHTQTLDKNYIIPMGENSDAGSTAPIYYERGEKDVRTILQSDYSQVMENVTSVTVPATYNYEITRAYAKLVNSVTNFKLKIEVNENDVAYYPSKHAWDDDTVDGYDLDAGEVYIDFEPHFSFLTSYDIVMYYKADQQIDLLGDGTLNWFAVDKKDLTIQYLALDVVETTTFLNNANQSIVIGPDTIRNALILYYCNDTTTYEGGQVILVSDGTTCEIDAERIGESDLVIDNIEFSTSIVDTNLCLDITATGDGSKTVTLKYKIFSIS